MSFLDKLEKRFGSWAIRGLTNYIVVGQALTFLMVTISPPDVAMRMLDLMEYRLTSFLGGNFWNPISFILIPKTFSLIWIFFSLMILHMMGSALEEHWGAFRYNIYVLVGIVCVVISGVVFPYHAFSSYFLLTSIFLAFAYLYPNIELNIFFVLPVKMKWLGWFTFVLALFFVMREGPATKLEFVASLVNFPLFFGAEIVRGFRSKKRVRAMKIAKAQQSAEPFHICSVCGATDLSHPDREFRYRKEGGVCSDCVPPTNDR